MGILRTTLAASGWGTLITAGAFMSWTRQCHFADIPPTDYLFNSSLYARYNPNNAPVTQDQCVRRVPLSKIKPELLEHDGKLIEAFCAGIWSGLGYAYQRRYLEKKHRQPETQQQLWDTTDLKSSTYDVGTQITDHFEVLAKTSTSIIVRCGDSPRKMEVRESDGLFEMLAEVNREEGVAEFSLKSLFYNGMALPDKQGKPPSPPMTPWIQWLHMQYDKILMETAVSSLTR